MGSFKLNTENVVGEITQILIYDYAGNIKEEFEDSQTQFNVDYAQGMYVIVLKINTDAVYTQK